MTPEPISRAFRVSTVCARLEIGKTKLYEIIATGQLRAVKVGGATRILATDLAAFEASLPKLELRRDVARAA